MSMPSGWRDQRTALRDGVDAEMMATTTIGSINTLDDQNLFFPFENG